MPCCGVCPLAIGNRRSHGMPAAVGPQDYTAVAGGNFDPKQRRNAGAPPTAEIEQKASTSEGNGGIAEKIDELMAFVAAPLVDDGVKSPKSSLPVKRVELRPQ